MQKDATPADQSILRDYLSPINLSTIWASFRCRDLAVLLSTLGSLLLQLAVSKSDWSKMRHKLIVPQIITSAALILLESTPVEKAGEVTLASRFVSIQNISASPVTGAALVRYYGIQSGNLTFPAATSANLTVEKFLPQEGSPANTSYTANVGGMSAGLECEALNVPNVTDRVAMPWRSILAPFFSINITTPSCNISGIPIGMGTDHNPPHTDITSTYQGWWSNYTCNDGVQNYRYPDNPEVPLGRSYPALMITA